MTSSFVGAAVALIFLLLAVILPVCVGVAVYRDARSRGMEAGLWTLVRCV